MANRNSPLSEVSRRSLITAAGAPVLGLGANPWALLQRAVAAPQQTETKQARSCVLFFLFGGPSQIDLWDMKPTAPVEIRGDFRPVSTSVAGLMSP